MEQECNLATRITGVLLINKPKHERNYGWIEVDGMKIRILFNPLKEMNYRRKNLTINVKPTGQLSFSRLQPGNHFLKF